MTTTQDAISLASARSVPLMPKLAADQHALLQQADMAVSLAFARIVTVLMRTSRYADLPLGQLENMVLPPLLNGQYAILDGAVPGAPVLVPIAALLWARVSDEVDARLSSVGEIAVRLGPNDWTSGGNYWLIDAIGDRRSVAKLVAEIDKVFAGKQVKMRVVGSDGQIGIRELVA